MNTKIKTTALVCAALFAVTACSSSGESGPDINPSNTITPSKPTTPAKPTTPETPAKPATPETPAKPATPETPAKPATPETPAKPATPVTPAKPATPETPAKPATPVTPAKPATPNTPKPSPSASIGGTALAGKNFSYNTAKYVVPSGNMNTSVTVDGRTIDLSKANEAYKLNYEIGTAQGGKSTQQTMLSGRKYSHVRFGAHTTEGAIGTNIHHYHDTFAIGNITPLSGANALPTTGKATYVGDAALSTGAVWLESEAKFNVDFGAKTINGEIDSLHKIPLKGTISGASFSGDQDGISMKGNFFGPKAAELGGVFSAEHERSSYQGSFGAKKQ